MTTAERDAFKAVVANLGTLLSTLDEDTCSCREQGWWGEGHATACPLYYREEADAAYKAALEVLR